MQMEMRGREKLIIGGDFNVSVWQTRAEQALVGGTGWAGETRLEEICWIGAGNRDWRMWIVLLGLTR